MWHPHTGLTASVTSPIISLVPANDTACILHTSAATTENLEKVYSVGCRGVVQFVVQPFVGVFGLKWPMKQMANLNRKSLSTKRNGNTPKTFELARLSLWMGHCIQGESSGPCTRLPPETLYTMLGTGPNEGTV